MRFILLALLLCAGALSAHAATLTLGVGYGHGESEYKGVPGYMEMFGYRGPLPIVNFDSKLVSLGVTDGLLVHMLNNGLFTADILLAPFSNNFDPDKSKSRAMERLDEREMTLATGVALGLNTPYGSLKAVGKIDILDESNSMTFSLGYSKPFVIVPEHFMLIPAAEITFANAKHYDYYYGVSTGESIRSGIARYSVDDSDYSTGVSITAIYMFNKNVSMMANYGIEFLADAVQDSPMVNESTTWHAVVGITYTFDLGDGSPRSKPATVKTSGQPRNAQPNSTNTLRNSQNTRDAQTGAQTRKK